MGGTGEGVAEGRPVMTKPHATLARRASSAARAASGVPTCIHPAGTADLYGVPKVTE
jgi:hypothetical protein